MIRILTAAALSAAFLISTPASAGTVTSDKLDGTIDGLTTIFKVDLSATGLGLLTGVTLTDANDLSLNGSNALFSGLDIDAVFISTTDCDSAACAAGLTPLAAFDYANASFSPGGTMSPSALFGASGSVIDHGTATLGAVDGMIGATVSGFFSLGLGGQVTINLTNTLDLLNTAFYLYIAEVGGNGAELTETSISLQGAALAGEAFATPIPAAAPLLLSGLAGLAFARRRRRA
jgi:hypothetical protein